MSSRICQAETVLFIVVRPVPTVAAADGEHTKPLKEKDRDIEKKETYA